LEEKTVNWTTAKQQHHGLFLRISDCNDRWGGHAEQCLGPTQRPLLLPLGRWQRALTIM